MSDITLADFWGIEKYNPGYETDKGVSMLIINSEKGNDLLDAVRSKIKCEEFPLNYGVESNFCLTHTTERPKKRDEVIESLNNFGYDKTAEKYFTSSWKNSVYWLLPAKFRTIIRRIRG